MTLYDQIGGEPAVRAAVEQFYARLLADPMIGPFFENTDRTRLKAHQFAFLSQALGGPQRYSGAAMSRAHARLRIEQRHFDAVVAHLAETLRELGVSQQLVAQAMQAIAPLASQIVNASGAASA
ncbi:MAG TPA: group 1 truncated hemoglobin [Bryobacteraceae bacterium]|nr:group 1 truncated hemoglobin [Bryobacteraceae bacterium]